MASQIEHAFHSKSLTTNPQFYSAVKHNNQDSWSLARDWQLGRSYVTQVEHVCQDLFSHLSVIDLLYSDTLNLWMKMP